MSLHDRLLFWWGRLHIGEVIRRRALRRALAPLLCDSIRVLDAGCGRGDNAFWVARQYPKIHIDAVDADSKIVELVQQRVTASGLRNISTIVGNIEQWRMERKAYDIIYSVDVFEHLKDPGLALTSIATALAPGGILLIHVPRAQQRRWFQRFKGYAQRDHERDGFEPDDFIALLRSAAFAPVAIRHTFGPPGALAWELFHLAQGIGKWFALLTYSVPWFLTWLDGMFRWGRGNGILIIAKNVKVQSSNVK